MAQEWHPVDCKPQDGVKVYCAWCGRVLGIPRDSTLPLRLKCRDCNEIFSLERETDLEGRAVKALPETTLREE